MNTRNHAERIADNIECASQVRWASESHREDAIRNIEAGLKAMVSTKIEKGLIEIKVGSYEELIEAIRLYQAEHCTDNDRIEFWNSLREGYCHCCGCDDPGCHCSNDE